MTKNQNPRLPPIRTPGDVPNNSDANKSPSLFERLFGKSEPKKEQSLQQHTPVTSSAIVLPPQSSQSSFGNKLKEVTSAITSRIFQSSSSQTTSEESKGVQYYLRSRESITSSAGNISAQYPLNWDKCMTEYGQRDYLPESQRRLPPMLYTFPGSGNTWCRLLIERATGILSGSVYNDRKLLQALPGEFTCDWRVSVVKTHPHTHTFIDLFHGTFNSDANKCKRGNVDGFKRAILLIRDPYDSIWSEYQRRVSTSHVEGIRRNDFSWVRWKANAASLSHRYLEMWRDHYGRMFHNYKPEDVLIIKYEDLKDKSLRVSVLYQVVKFLRMDIPVERLHCAFVLAESRSAHRKTDPAIYMTKTEAFTEELSCKMWALFGKFASRYGYGVFAGYNCTTNNALPIRDMVVGPAGQFDESDLQWVANGGTRVRGRGGRSRGGRARAGGAVVEGGRVGGTGGAGAGAGAGVPAKQVSFRQGQLGNLGLQKAAWKSDEDDH